MDWIHPWIGLGWIESNSGECCVDWIGLDPMTVICKILTAYVFQRNRPRLLYVIFSDFCFFTFQSWLVLIMNNHLQCHGLIYLSTCSINCKNESNSETWCFRRQNEQWIGLDSVSNLVDWVGLDFENGPTDISDTALRMVQTVSESLQFTRIVL